MPEVAEVIRELMELQQMSVRKVSARIAEQHGGSVHGYTQQISRILNDPIYDPSLSTVQKILAALNVSLWQVSGVPVTARASAEQYCPPPCPTFQQISDRLDQLSTDVATLRTGITNLQQSVSALTGGFAASVPGSIDNATCAPAKGSA